MTKWRILHIPSGQFVTETETIGFTNRMVFGTVPQYGIGEYKDGKVYETYLKWSASRMLHKIFAGAVYVSKEVMLFTDNRRCEFEVVKT